MGRNDINLQARCLFLALCGLLALPASAQATFPGKNGKIAYNALQPGWARIHAVDEYGGNLRDYSSETTADMQYEPAWSPDGMKLAFYGNYELEGTAIFIMNADGSNRQVVVPGPWSYGPAWSHDGTRLAFGTVYCSKYGCVNTIEWASVDGTGYGSVAYGVSPDWAPDGDRLAFERAGEIYAINLDGTGEVRLTNNTANDVHAEWLPDGERIAFASNRDGNYEIYVVNEDGTGETRVTNSAAHETNPAWSPDGTKLVFERTTHSDPIGCWDTCDAAIYKMNADGSGPVIRISQEGTSSRIPDWQPAFGHARPRGATPTTVKLVPAFEQCGSPNGNHGAPLSVPSCDPPVQASQFLTVGTADANGKAATSTGSVNLRVRSCPQCASPLPPDVLVDLSLTDVRNRFSLTDYTGELEGVLQVRVTDSYNGPPYDRSGTVPDFPLSFPISCTATDDVTIGSTCATSTSANAIMPGLVRDFTRAVWQLGQVTIYDGGPDGDADTPGNTPFMVQGLFAP